jgi:hypothetical protein
MKTAFFIILGVLVVAAIAWVIGFIFFRARMQHYIFAHQWLPSQMFGDPVTVLGALASATGSSEEGRIALRAFWEAAGEGQSSKDVVSSDALTYSTEVLGHPNSTAYLVTLPPPVKKTEAHFALMVFDAPGLCCGTLRQLRYFVLEYYGPSKTQLGEWIRKDDGSLKYADHGTGTPPDRESFLARVQQIIEVSGSQPTPVSQT